MLLGHDQDFGGLLAVSGNSRPSWINLRVTRMDTATLVATILKAIEAARDELEHGAIVTVDDRGMRVHRLPIA